LPDACARQAGRAGDLRVGHLGVDCGAHGSVAAAAQLLGTREGRSVGGLGAA
jgi:hypothetical protein